MPSKAHPIPFRESPIPPHRDAPDDGPPLRRRVVAELVGLGEQGSQVRLRIAESESGYEVTAEFEAVPTDTFDVQIEHDKVYIGFEGGRLPPAGGRHPDRWTTAQADRPHVAIAFPHPLDAAASHGEFGDRIVHLSLRKEARGVARPPVRQPAPCTEEETACAV